MKGKISPRLREILHNSPDPQAEIERRRIDKPAAQPKEDLPELLDQLIQQHTTVNYLYEHDKERGLQRGLPPEVYEHALEKFNVTRSAIEAFVARLESENERLKDTALTGEELGHIQWALRVAGLTESIAGPLISKLRRRSATSEETS